MRTNEAIQSIIGSAGLTPYGASLALKRTHSYITSLLKRKGGVSAPVLATIADVCDYDLMLVPRDKAKDTIRIDPQDTARDA
jgi:hypothetical protein